MEHTFGVYVRVRGETAEAYVPPPPGVKEPPLVLCAMPAKAYQQLPRVRAAFDELARVAFEEVLEQIKHERGMT